MTVQIQNSTQYYAGPISVGTEISVTDFTFVENSHVSVKVRGASTNWIYGSDYLVSGAGTLDRRVTVLKEVEENEILAVFLDVPITQGVSPEEGGNLPAATLEYTLDKLTYICQDLNQRVKRALQVSIDSNFNGVIYDAASNIGKAFIVNDLGTGVDYSTYKVSDLEYIAKRLYTSIDNIDIVADNISSVLTDAQNITSINTNAQHIANIDTTALYIDKVDVVANDLSLGDASEIHKVNANKTNIDITAENIEDIQNAYENAQTCITKAQEATLSAFNAAESEDHAEIWAEGTDEQVQALGGVHSSKGWANVSSQQQIQSDCAENDSTEKSYIQNKDLQYFDNTTTRFETTLNKGQANGYCPLDANAKIDETYLPKIDSGMTKFAINKGNPDLLINNSNELAFDVDNANPLTYTNIMGETKTVNALLPIDVSGTPYFYENFTKVGNPIINNGVISNFSNDNYIVTPEEFNPQSSIWEIVRKIKTPSSFSRQEAIICQNSTNTSINITINSSGKFQNNLAHTSGSWDIWNERTGVTTLSPNTDYWFKLRWTGTSFEFLLSTTGAFSGEETTEMSTNSTTPMTLNQTYIQGATFTGYFYPFSGSIDFKECYDKINNNIVWSCMKSTSDGTYKVALPQSGNQPYLFDGDVVVSESEPINEKTVEITPVMTSATSPSGTVTGTGTLVGTQYYQCIGNNSEVTQFSSSSGSVTYTYGELQQAGKYKLSLYQHQDPAFVSSRYWTSLVMKVILEDDTELIAYQNNSMTSADVFKTYSGIVETTKKVKAISFEFTGAVYTVTGIAKGFNLQRLDKKQNTVWLNPQEPNSAQQWNNADWQDFNDIILQDSSVTVESGVITDLKQPTYNYNGINLNQTSKTDREFISRMSSPSNTKINYTIGASDSKYESPADGEWSIFGTGAINGGCYIALSNLNNNDLSYISTGGAGYGIFTKLRVKKGDILLLQYANVSFQYMHFIPNVGGDN